MKAFAAMILAVVLIRPLAAADQAMRASLAAAAFTLAICAAPDAEAATYTIGQMRQHCTSIERATGGGPGPGDADAALSTGLCFGFLDAVSQSLAIGCQMREVQPVTPSSGGPLAAATYDLSSFQLIKTFLNWAEKNRPRWGENSFSGAVYAFRESYPCKS
jgi:hypothetical protein